MDTLHEALARERMREQTARSHHERVAGELAAARRWHRLERHAHAAGLRHTQRAHRAASTAAEAR